MRSLLVASFHRAAGLAWRGNHRSFGADFVAPRRTPGISSQGILSRIRGLFLVGCSLWLLISCFFLHGCSFCVSFRQSDLSGHALFKNLLMYCSALILVSDRVVSKTFCVRFQDWRYWFVCYSVSPCCKATLRWSEAERNEPVRFFIRNESRCGQPIVASAFLHACQTQKECEFPDVRGCPLKACQGWNALRSPKTWTRYDEGKVKGPSAQGSA